jgi:hypothetical protein
VAIHRVAPATSVPPASATARARHWLASPRGTALLLFVGAAAVRAALATRMVFPPLGDAAYYISVAQNLYAGHGLTIANIWNYQPPPATVVGPSNSYWGPLPSLAEWASFLIFGDHLYAALMPGILAGAALVALTYWWGRPLFARWLAGSRADGALPAADHERAAHWLALGAAVLLAVGSELTYQSVMGDSTMLYGLLGFAAIAVWERALRPAPDAPDASIAASPAVPEGMPNSAGVAPGAWARMWARVRHQARRWDGALPRGLLAGALLGLAYLTRGAAIFLAPVLAGWWLWRLAGTRRARGPQANGRGQIVATGAAFVVGAAVVLAPWLIRQQVVFGHALSSEATHNALAFSLADFFDYGSAPTFATLLSHGWGALLALRAQALWDAWHRTTDYLFYPTALPAVVGLCILARRSALAALGLAGFVLLLVGFGLLFPAVSLFGGFYHSVASVAPFLAWGEVALIALAARWARRHLPLRLSLAPALVAVALLLQLALLAFAFPVVGSGASDDRRIFGDITAWLRAHHARVVMATESTSLAYASGLPTIELPAAQPPAIVYACAQRYGAGYLVIAEQSGLYPQVLRDHPDPHFVLVAHQPAFDVYQIVP